MKHWLQRRAFPVAAEEQRLSRGVARGGGGLPGSRRWPLPAAALGLVLFGMLMLIISYAQAASGLSKFQSWQLIIRYGGAASDQGRRQTLQDATGFAFGARRGQRAGRNGRGDRLAAADRRLVRDRREQYLGWRCSIACCLPTMGAATPTGVLRALDRFDLISWQGTANPIARAILAGIAWWHELAAACLCRHLVRHRPRRRSVLLVPRWRELKRRGPAVGNPPDAPPTALARRLAVRHPGQHHIRSLDDGMGTGRQADRRRLLGPAAPGLYRIAPGLADSANKPADLLAKAYYPEVCGWTSRPSIRGG